MPEAAFLVIAAAMVFQIRNGVPRRDALAWGKQRAKLAGISNFAGLAVEYMTGTVVFRPATTIAIRAGAEANKILRNLEERSRATLETLEGVLAGYRVAGLTT